MFSNIIKRIVLIIVDALFSWYIWQVNVSFGNPCYTTAFLRCFTLSVTTFLIVYTPFEIYFSFRNLWFDRWTRIYHEALEIENIKINIPDGSLSAHLIRNQDQTKIEKKRTIVVICHGFSDKKEKLQYLSLPLAYQGYNLLVYDARGTGKSKKTGKRSQFTKRIDDFKNIIEWVKKHKDFSNYKISCIGFSIGAITVLSGGFLNNDIEKIIAISSISNYKKNIPKYNPIVLLSYKLKRVKLFPTNEENYRLSPYKIIEEAKEALTNDEWRDLSKRVMLIHCKNDRVIKYKNMKENKMMLESPFRNLIILKKGGHSHKKNENILVGATLNFLNIEL